MKKPKPTITLATLIRGLCGKLNAVVNPLDAADPINVSVWIREHDLDCVVCPGAGALTFAQVYEAVFSKKLGKPK